MKKSICLVLLLTLFGSYGCMKDDLIQSSSTIPESQSKRMLIFESSEAFENILENLAHDELNKIILEKAELGFEDYFSVSQEVTKSTNDSTQKMDDLFGKMLNEDGVIQIGDHVFKIDLQKDQVFVIPSELKAEHYNDLIIGNTNNRFVTAYSTGQDVLHLLNGEPEEKCGGIGSGEYSCYSSIYNSQLVKTNTDGSVERLAPFVKFFKAGIYFRLSSQYQVLRFPTISSTNGEQVISNISSNGYTVEMFVRGPEGWWRNRPCNSNSIGTRSSGFHYSNSVNGSHSVTLYSGTRNLNGYYFFVQGRVKYSNGSYTTASPYGGRNINSPY